MEFRLDKMKIGLSPGNKIRLPSKRTINLATATEKPLNWKIGAPGIFLILLFALIFSRVAVSGRLNEAARAERETAALQQELDAGHEKILSYGDLMKRYAHYTYSGFTEEELALADRASVFDLLEKYVYPAADVGAWTLKDNEVGFFVTNTTLNQVNEMVEKLKTDPQVDYCTIMTASTDGDLSARSNTGAAAGGAGRITAQITVHLKPASAEDDQEILSD